MNLVVNDNSKLKTTIECYLNENKNRDVFVFVKTRNLNKTINSLEDFFVSDKRCFEDENIAAICFEDIKLSRDDYISMVKREREYIEIRKKVLDYKNFALST